MRGRDGVIKLLAALLPLVLGWVRSGRLTACAQLWLLGGYPFLSEATRWYCSLSGGVGSNDVSNLGGQERADATDVSIEWRWRWLARPVLHLSLCFSCQIMKPS